jgi:TatD DNase family protein
MSHLLFDSHIHFNANSFSLDSSHSCLSVSTHIEKPTSIEDNGLYHAVGLHPWFVNQDSILSLSGLNQMIESNQISAIGEIGLDYSSQYKETKSLQLKALAKQLNTAQVHNLAVSIHCVKAYDDLFKLLSSYDAKGFLHGFSSSYQQAERFLKLDFMIGVGLQALNPNNQKIIQLIQHLAIQKIVLETDAQINTATDLENAKSDMLKVAHKIAQIKAMPVDEVIEITYNNATQILGINHV